MKVLLDECLPGKLGKAISDHPVKTVREMGWLGKKNGELLRMADREFDVFVTIDQNLPVQQNLAKYKLSFIVLKAFRNSLVRLKPLMPRVAHALKEIQPGQVVYVAERPRPRIS